MDNPSFSFAMKHLLFVLISLLFYSCGTFSHYSRTTRIGTDETHTIVYNSKLKVLTRTFGDIEFALNRREFKALKDQYPEFKHILFYGTTKNPSYDYYVLINPENSLINSKNYDRKDTLINQNQIVVLISKSTPSSDKQFIFDNILRLD